MPKETNEINPGLDLEKLRGELKRVEQRKRYRSALRGTLSMLIVVAAIAVLVSMIWFPVLRVFGDSMTPTITEGQVIVAAKGARFKTGDVIGFYYGNKLLIKRCIAGPGDWVNIDESGCVFVNDAAIDEPYISDKALGDCNIELPYQVPEGRYFVMGDNRSISVDSRNTTMGCIAEEHIVGRILLCIWPLSDFGIIREVKQ